MSYIQIENYIIDTSKILNEVVDHYYWFRGSKTNRIEFNNNDGNTNDQYGPGVYFTDSYDTASNYGKVYLYEINTDKGFIKQGTKVSKQIITKLVNYVDRSILDEILLDWDENPIVAKKELINAICNNKDMVEALQQYALDVCRWDREEYIMNCKAVGINGIIVKNSEYHDEEWLVLYNFNLVHERDIDIVDSNKVLNEWTLKTLMSKDSISDFTMKFRKERSKIMGQESSTAKLIDCFINETDDSITFAWYTPATDYSTDKAKSVVGEDRYKKMSKQKKMRVQPLNLKLLPNNENQYEVQLKITKFFSWLDTYPDKTEITSIDLKDILKVADVQVFSSSPSFQYQAYNWNNSQVDTAIYPTDIAPKVWDKYNDNAFLDKHLYGIMRNMEFWLNPMASMITKRLQDKGYL